MLRENKGKIEVGNVLRFEKTKYRTLTPSLGWMNFDNDAVEFKFGLFKVESNFQGATETTDGKP